MKLRQRTPKPCIRFVDIPERVFGECLHAKQSDRPIGFLNSEGLLFLGAMTACALGNDQPFDFLVGESGLRQAFRRSQRKSLSYSSCELRLRAHDPAKDGAPTKLPHYNFDYRQ